MTRKEAIELLTYMMISYIPKDQYGDYDDPEPYEQAVDMAIESLQKDIERHEMVIRASERHLGIVRCKDCKHGQYDATHYFCAEHGHKVYEDDFCSHGEHKGGDDE